MLKDPVAWSSQSESLSLDLDSFDFVARTNSTVEKLATAVISSL